MAKDEVGANAPKQLSLQVPKNVNLVKMSNEEIEELATSMARKAATALGKDSAVLGVDRVVLSNTTQTDVGVWGQWSRACGKRDLSREGVVVNPEAFTAPVQADIAKTASSKAVIENRGGAVKASLTRRSTKK